MESRLNGPGGGFTTHAAAKMAEGIGGVLTTCTITGHHQTFIFELPGCYLVAEGTVGAHVIYSADGFTAAVVSDLLAYFEHGGTTSTHYSLDVSLREEVARVYEQERVRQSDPQVPIFLVVEQQEQVPTITLDKECFVVGCFRHQLLLPSPYLVLTKPLRLDIQCQRAASVKIGWKYLDD